MDINQIQIDSITETKMNCNLNYTISSALPNFGSKLCIDLPPKDDDPS